MKKEFELVYADVNSRGLGDTLVMMLSSRTRNDLIYVLPPHSARFAPLFQGIAPVMVMNEWQSKRPALPESEGPSKLPFLRLSKAEIQQAEQSVSPEFKPIAITVNCSPAWTHLRETDGKHWQKLVDRFRESGRAVFQFGTSTNFTWLDGTIKMIDLPVRRLAAMLKVIGVYVGVDTGDYHVAVAVGSKAFVAIPDECSDYRYKDWHYDDPSIRYFNFRDLKHIYDSVAGG